LGSICLTFSKRDKVWSKQSRAAITLAIFIEIIKHSNIVSGE
jgi:hypothetical protein